MKRHLAIVTVGYFLSRVVFYLVGIRMQGLVNISTFLQFIDPELLKHDLLASLYYSSFPPLYNLITGIFLKLFGLSPVPFAIFHLLLGWAIGLVMWLLMTDLGIRPRLATAATLLYLILPPVILFENWIFYTYLETLCFLLAAWSFHRFLLAPQLRWGLTLFSCATALALLNARMMLFALIIAAFLWWTWRRTARPPVFARAALLSAAPLLLVVGVMAKNAWLFGEFTVDPHFGFHMGNGFVYGVWRDPEMRDTCVRDYPILLVSPTIFPPAEKSGLDAPPPTGVPLLDDPLRSTGVHNYNSLYYIEVSHLYSEVLGEFIREHPNYYGRFVWRAWVNYWEPADDFIFDSYNNRAAIRLYDDSYFAAYPFFLALYLAGAICAIIHGCRNRWTGASAATLAFMLATVGYNLLAIFVTLTENNRYKFTIEPLLWILAVLAIQQWWQRRRKSAAPLPPGLA